MLMLSMAACSDKDPKEPDTPDDPKGEMEQLSPLESKKFLEETATEALNKFKAADQRDVIVLCSYFCDEYGDLDAPDEFEVEPTETGSIPGRYVRELAKALSTGDASRAGTAAVVYTYDLNFELFKGVYEPAASRWVKTGDSNDIIFKFTDATGKQCELKAVASSSTSDGEISYVEDDYYYDYENGSYVDYEEETVYKFRIPKEVTVTLANAGTTLVTAKVNSDISLSGHKFNVAASVVAANLEAAVKADGTDSQVSQTSSLKVSGELLANTAATVNGSHLCDIDFYREMDDDTENKLMSLLQDGTATVSLLNKVRIDGVATYNRSVYKALNDSYGYWEYDTRDEAESAVKSAVEALNSNVRADVRYNNKETVQATLLWKYTFDSWGYNSWEYMIEPLIKFNSDETTYSFEEYFESGFTSVEDLWESLVKSYEKVWDSVR